MPSRDVFELLLAAAHGCTFQIAESGMSALFAVLMTLLLRIIVLSGLPVTTPHTNPPDLASNAFA